jgi:DNA-nicking Smr family endonuclease
MGGEDVKLSPEELGLFEDAVSGARLLPQEVLPPEGSLPPPARAAGARDAEALRELEALVRGEIPLRWQDSDQWHQSSVPGLDPRVLRKLVAGEFAVQADLDLHGSCASQARMRVERFLLEAVARRLRCVRIVHGRGRGSPDGEPVLKRQLPRWLSRGPARRSVLAYSSAAPKDGGVGATYVLLRGGRGG